MGNTVESKIHQIVNEEHIESYSPYDDLMGLRDAAGKPVTKIRTDSFIDITRGEHGSPIQVTIQRRPANNNGLSPTITRYDISPEGVTLVRIDVSPSGGAYWQRFPDDLSLYPNADPATLQRWRMEKAEALVKEVKYELGILEAQRVESKS